MSERKPKVYWTGVTTAQIDEAVLAWFAEAGDWRTVPEFVSAWSRRMSLNQGINSLARLVRQGRLERVVPKDETRWSTTYRREVPNTRYRVAPTPPSAD